MFTKNSVIKNGFTIIELIVVISIIGILASIVIVSYSSWKQSTTIAQLKSDLSGVASAMENARNFGNTYPTTVPSTFVPSSGVTLSGGGLNSGTSYCVDATNGAQSYHISSQYSTPLVGVCPVLYLDANNSVSYSGTGTTWTDLSGYGNNGTLAGGAFKENDYMVCNGTAGGNDDMIEIPNSAASPYFNNPTNLTMMIVAQINRESGVFGADTNVYGHIIGKGTGDGLQTAMNAYSIFYDARNNYMTNGFYRGTPSTQYPNQIGAYRFEYGWADSQTANNWGEKFMAFQVIRGDGNYSYYWYRAGDTTITGSGTYTTGGTFDNAYNLRICADYAGRYNKQRTWMASFYNKALTATEVQQIYNDLRSRFGI